MLVVAFTAAVYFVFLQPKPIALSYTGEVLKLFSGGEESGYINGIFYAYNQNGTWQYFDGTNWAYVSVDDLPLPYSVSLDLHSDITLYNCNVKVTYQAANGAWVTVGKNIGIVDFSKNAKFVLEGYQIEPNAALTWDKTVEFSNLNPLATIKIDAYGTSKP